MRWVFLAFCCWVSSVAWSQIPNRMLAEVEGKADPIAPVIAISHKTPSNIVVALATGKVFHTMDGGENWKESVLKSDFGFYGASALVSSKGDFFYAHASNPDDKGQESEAWLDRIVCHASSDKGITWSAGGFVGNAQKDLLDPCLAISQKNGDIFAAWTQFDTYGLKDEGCTSNIFMSMSSNGNKWSRPSQISQTPGNCLDDDATARGAAIAVSFEGRAFLVWAGHELIYMDRSYDGGNTWLSNDLALTKQVGGWSQTIPGIGKVAHTPSFAIDASRQRMHGTLSLLFADQRNGESDTDIWYFRSNNHGDNWTAPQRINNDPPGKQQFLPAMTIDQMTGHVFIVYYDRRAYDDLQTDVYLAYSKDGGNNFTELKISQSPFSANESGALGGPISVAAHGGNIVMAWTRTDGSKTSVMAAVFKEESLATPK